MAGHGLRPCVAIAVVVLLLGGACSPAPPVALEQAWSRTGDPNPFSWPDGLALDALGSLYVMDSGNQRIQKLDSDGNFIATWGSAGSGDGQFDCSRTPPYDLCMVAVDGQGNVFVTDNNNARVQKFDSNGRFQAQWGSLGAGAGQFDSPFGIAVDRQGNVYVGDVGNARVQKFDGSGSYLSAWGSPGNEDGQFSGNLADLAVDAQGNVFVTDRSNGIQKFDGSAQFVAKLSTCGDDREVSQATGVAFDTTGNLYAFDMSNRRLCKYDSEGRFLAQWDGSGSVEGPFTIVGGIAVDQQGAIYVGELFNGRIRKFLQP